MAGDFSSFALPCFHGFSYENDHRSIEFEVPQSTDDEIWMTAESGEKSVVVPLDRADLDEFIVRLAAMRDRMKGEG